MSGTSKSSSMILPRVGSSLLQGEGAVALILATGASLALLALGWMFGDDLPVLIAAAFSLALLPAGIGIVIFRPKLIPYLLIIAVHISLFVSVTIGPLNLRPNMLLALVAAGFLVCRLILGAEPFRPLPCIGLFLATNAAYLLSTLVHTGSGFYSRGVADCGLLFVNILQYSLIVWFLAHDRRAFDQAVRLFLVLTALYGGANVLVFILGELGIGPFPQMLESVPGETGWFLRVKGFSTTEGTYMGFGVVTLLALVILNWRRLPFSRMQTFVMLGSSFVALIFTFSRGPWLEVGVTVVLMLTTLVFRLPRRRAAKMVMNVAMALLLLAGVGSRLASGSIADMVFSRFEAFSATDTGTMGYRMLVWGNMLEDWTKSPWLGHGAHDYAKFLYDPKMVSENFPLELLHSAGLIGFGLFFLAISYVGLRGLRLFASPRGMELMPWGFPLLAGFVAICIGSLSNPGMWGGYFWVVLALLVCAEELTT